MLVHIQGIRLLREVVRADNLSRLGFRILLPKRISAPRREIREAHVLFLIVMCSNARSEPIDLLLPFLWPLALLLDIAFRELGDVDSFSRFPQFPKLYQVRDARPRTGQL